MASPQGQTTKPRRRLARRLVAILVGLALLQLVVGGGLLLFFSYRNQLSMIDDVQRQAAEKAAMAIDNVLRYTVDQMNFFVATHDKALILEGAANPTAAREVRTLLQWEAILEVWVLDAEGDEILQNSYDRMISPEQYGSRADRPEYTAIMAGQSSYIGPVHIPSDPVFSMWPISTLAVPIAIAGRVEGVLVVELNTSDIQNVIAHTALGPRSYAYVVDRQGILRVHWSDTRVALEERDLSHVPAVQAFLARRGETVQYSPGLDPAIDGAVLGTWAPLEMADWGVVVEQPTTEAFRGLNQLLILLIALLGASLLVAFLVGMVVANRFLRPLQMLQEGARQLGAGNLAHRIDIHSRDEIEVLASTFNEMAERVQSSHHAIEVQVQQRTGELAQAYEDLSQQSAEQGRLLNMIRQMSIPVIPVLEGIVVMPLIGNIDSERAIMVTQALLSGIEEHRAKVAILDITGVPVVDTAVGNALLQAMRAANLLGVQSVLVGITPEVAQTVVHLGVDLSRIVTRSSLQTGVEYAIRWLRGHSRD